MLFVRILNESAMFVCMYKLFRVESYAHIIQ